MQFKPLFLKIVFNRMFFEKPKLFPHEENMKQR